mgnify:CR=1 FL=1
MPLCESWAALFMNKTEILHYLRTASRVDDPRLLALIDDCMAEVDATVQPRTLERIFPCRVTEDALEVEALLSRAAAWRKPLPGAIGCAFSVPLWALSAIGCCAPTRWTVLPEVR